jgi:hypothetical protein
MAACHNRTSEFTRLGLWVFGDTGGKINAKAISHALNQVGALPEFRKKSHARLLSVA